jgi:hypothetical protein
MKKIDIKLEMKGEPVTGLTSCNISGVSEIELRNKIIGVLSDISRMESKGEWYGFMHDKKNAGMITKMWNYCR